MGATLGSLITDVQVNLDVISRELTGLIPAVTLDADVARAAIGQNVRSFVAPAVSAQNVSAAHTTPDDGDQTIGSITMGITKARRVPIRWTGEEQRAAGNSVPGGTAAILAAQIQQAMRTLVNEIEADIAALHATCSRAAGTAGQTPFGTANDYTAASLARKILVDNGAPLSDLQLVLNTAAGANIRGKQAAAADAGSDSILRQGVLLDINGMQLRESAQVVTSVAGTMSGGSTTGTHAVGATVLALKNTTGTGACVAGDVITIAGDTNQYVVTAVNQAGANPATGDTITIAAPGLRVGFTADRLITVVAAAARNMAFSKSALILATRLPALPDGGDLAVDRTTVTDPRTGLSFELAMYPGYRQMKYELMIAWGVKNVKPEHTALLLG
jgi:translation initiation factor 1 (eIF-1/SUI1)